MNTIPSMEEQFISKLNTIVDSNFTNEQFSVSDLASQMGMSRATLHRRLKTISGKPVSQYINERRLAYAKDLLENRAGTVSDIAFMVGFGSSSYFTKCFHDFYGYRPGDLLKEKLPETKDLSENTVARQSKKKTITGILAGIFVLTALVLILALVLKKSKTNIPLHKSDVLSKSPAAVNFYQQGNGLMEVYTGSRAKEHFLEAKDKYEAALRLDSTFGDAYCRLAGIYFSEMSYSSGTGQGNYYSYVDSGKVYLDKAQKFGVVDIDYYLQMSSIYYQHIRDYKRALAILEQRWDNKEKSYDYYDEKGNHSFFMRQYSETINNLLYYLQLKPDSILPKYDRLQKLTTIFSLAGFQDEAREFAYRQFELNNDSSQYTAWYPQIVFECGNFDEALKIYEKAYQQNKVGTTVYNKLLEIYLLSNNSQEGLKLLNEYVEYSDGIYTQIVPNYIIAYYHHLNGEQELAEQQFNEEIKRWEYFCSINEFQQSMQNYLTIAACYAMLGDKEGTIANLKKLNQKSSIPYLAVLRLKQSPMFNNFKNDKDFRAIKTKIEDKYLEEQKIIQTILKKHPVDFTFQQINNIHFYN